MLFEFPCLILYNCHEKFEQLDILIDLSGFLFLDLILEIFLNRLSY